ncbi:MAG: Tex-like N-terminal domain-containing protein [Fimbriiglobus sp.]
MNPVDPTPEENQPEPSTPEQVPTTPETSEPVQGETGSTTEGTVLGSLSAPTPPPPPPALPPQPVPTVPAAPSSHDLSRMAQDFQLRKAQVEAVVQLLDEQNTVPFITRYRKERTGGLDEIQIRRIQSRIESLREIANRKQTILRSVAHQGKLTDPFVEAVLNADNLKRLEDLYLPFKAKKKSLAQDAKDKGLEPLSLAVWNQLPESQPFNEVIAAVVDPWKQLHDTNDVLNGVKSILAEIVSEQPGVRGTLRGFLWATAEIVSTKIETVPEGKGTDYRDYFQFKEACQAIPPHRVLAINRGERENILRVRIQSNRDEVKRLTKQALQLEGHVHKDLIESVVDDAVDRMILPSLEREMRREMTEVSQDHAVDIFARNLGSLLMRPRLGGKRVLAIDPGVRTGCKVAVLDETGTLLEDAVIYPHPPKKDITGAKRKLEQLLRKHQCEIIAIGNGTACRETEQLVSDMIAELAERRLNPPPATSPIPQEAVVTPSVPAPVLEQPVAVEAPVTTLAATTETTSVLGVAETTMTLPGVTLGESVSTSTAPAPAAAVVAPPEPPAEVISFEGLPEAPTDLAYVIVNEAGATEYSASSVAQEEFPTLDATTRGTISIGRRLQDPLAELVKLEPQHIGVGLYQHDVRAKYLRTSVERVIESCVNAVGVDLNTASMTLLKNVSGLNQLVARSIVEVRAEKGAFKSREELKAVPQMGEIRFTQSAGFLRIAGGSDPLDTTSVHPESYELARKVLTEFGFSPDDLTNKEKLTELREKLKTITPDDMAAKLQAGPPTINDIYHAIARPGRDPREDRPEPIFRKGVLKLEDLAAGMELRGEVLNVVDFGAFVDVGLKDSGLVHISQMANRYIKSPYDVISVGDVVKVYVMAVDKERRRVSLSMIPPGTERKPPERGERGERGERAPRPPRPEGERGPRPPRGPRPEGAPQGDRPQGDRPPMGDRPQGDRPPMGQGRTTPPPARGAGGAPPKPRGPKPGTPGAPGWRSAPKPVVAKPAEAEAPKPADAAAAAAKKAPAKPRPATKLTDDQKRGKLPVNSFAQLAALLKTKDDKPPETPEAPAEKPAE